MSPSSLPDYQPTDPLLYKVPEEIPAKPSWREYLDSEVDPENATAPLAVYCFMTGFIDAISFTAVFVWCGFQTGNFAQLALAFARSFKNQEIAFQMSDFQAVTSLVAFNLGAFLGRVGDRIGAQKRIWLVFGTLAQAFLTIEAAVCIWSSGQGSIALVRGEPSWTNGLTTAGLALMAASLGLQGIMGKRLNTHFSTTVVLTAIWVELLADPGLFVRRRIASRDQKLIALGSLFIGAVVARVLLGKLGAAPVLAIGAGIRVLIALAWVFVRGKGDGYTRLPAADPVQEDTTDSDVSEAEGGAIPNYGAVSVRSSTAT